MRALVAVAAVSSLISVAAAQSSPKAVTVRVKCELEGVNGTPATSTGRCQGLHGWFDGRLDWISNGTVLFSESGPFYGYNADSDEVTVFAGGNQNDATFGSVYADPTMSILIAPNLTLALYARNNANQPYTLVTEQRYMPSASALWSKHSEDSAGLAAQIIAGDKATLAAAEAYANATFVSLTGDQNVAGTKSFTGNMNVTGNETINGTLHEHNGTVWDTCPSRINGVAVPLGGAGLLCVSSVQTTAPSVTIDALISGIITPICDAGRAIIVGAGVGDYIAQGVQILTFGLNTAVNTGIIDSINTVTSAINNNVIPAMNQAVSGLNTAISAVITGVNKLIDGYDGMIGTLIDICVPIPGVGCDPLRNARASDLSTGNTIPSIPGFNATIGHIDIGSALSSSVISNALTSFFTSICSNLPTLAKNLLVSLEPQVTICSPVGNSCTTIPLDGNTMVANYDDAVLTCAGMGGHVCSTSEIFAYTNSSPAAVKALGPQGLGFTKGEWVAGGQLITNPDQHLSAVKFSGEWPPLKADLGKLAHLPPGVPLSVNASLAVPTGQFHCCASNVDIR
jgi:hypothetical protein